LSVAGLSTNYDTGWGSVVNSLGYARFAADDENQDATVAFASAFGRFLHLTSPPIAYEAVNQSPESKKLTDELRFTSIRMNHFLWQVGLFHTHENVTFPHLLEAISFPRDVPLPAPINPLLNAQQSGSYSEYVGFGDLTYYLTDALDATAGVRYSHNQQHDFGFSLGALGEGSTATVAQNFSDSDTNYLFDLRWRPTQQVSTYLRAASAYRPGGPTNVALPGVPTSFGPDTDWVYEVGAKGRWLDGALNSNVAVYYIDWKDIQIATIFNGVASIVSNAGNAKSEGVEFDGTYEPVRGLVFGATASYDEAVVTSANPTNTAGARAGDPLPYTPKWSGAITADYSFPITPYLKGGLGASWAYQGWGYSSFSANTMDTREVIPSYALVGVRGHLDWSRYSAAVNVNNLANKRTFTDVELVRLFANQPVPYAYAYPLQPLTVRLTLSAKF
ncbi:MAG: TonB-dependent receptor, partial [Steroidobacteraceae bacterium]